MNKKEKLHFIGKLFRNHINYKGKKQYSKSIEILLDFLHFNLIDDDLFDECVVLLKESCYNDSFSSICELQEKLCKNFNIEIIY